MLTKKSSCKDNGFYMAVEKNSHVYVVEKTPRKKCSITINFSPLKEVLAVKLNIQLFMQKSSKNCWALIKT